MRNATASDTHVESVFVRAGFEEVWDRVSDPARFPELYPNWAGDVERIDADLYRGETPDGREFVVRVYRDREYGIVDVDVDDGASIERSRSRLFEVGDGTCVLVRLGIRRPGTDEEAWETYKREADEDLSRMKQLVEEGAPTAS